MDDTQRTHLKKLKASQIFRSLDQAFEQQGYSLDHFEQRAVFKILREAFENQPDVDNLDILDAMRALLPQQSTMEDDSEFCESSTDCLTIFKRSPQSGTDVSYLFGLLHQWRLGRERRGSKLTKRKKEGAYYTPSSVVHILIAEAEDWLRRHATFDSARICDPACGSGQFLVAWLEKRLQDAGQDAHRLVFNCLYGVDRDPVAVWMTRLSLWSTGSMYGYEIPKDPLRAQFRVGNAMLGSAWSAPNVTPPRAFLNSISKVSNRQLAKACHQWLDKRFAGLSAVEQANAWFATCLHVAGDFSDGETDTMEVEGSNPNLIGSEPADWKFWCEHHAIFHWFYQFPEVEAEGGFDLMIGNPPFVNAIELGLKNKVASAIYHLEAPLIRGSADIAYQFLRRALELCSNDGAVLFLLPRAIYSAASMTDYWASPTTSSRLTRSLLFENHRYFENASIFVTGSLWEKRVVEERRLEVARFDQQSRLVERRVGPQSGHHWWRSICSVLEGGHFAINASSQRLGDVFEVSSSMTTSEFYDSKSFLVDEVAPEAGVAMVTTGAIDPKCINWSMTSSRILGADYQAPRIQTQAFEIGPLKRRRARAYRPKILVAGLAARVEAVLLRNPAQGAVSTLMILHPNDDIAALESLEELLNAPWVSRYLRQSLGANAMGGGNITVSKRFIMDLPLDEPPWFQHEVVGSNRR